MQRSKGRAGWFAKKILKAVPYDNCVGIPTGAFNFNQEKALV